MGLLDTIKDVFNQGANNWYERLKPGLILTSPKGKKFNAKWIEDTMSIEKNVGLYNLPLAKGTIAHDLGVKSLNFTSLPFWFDGADCDLLSMAFVAAIKEKGTWKIDHPLRGFFELQPLKIDVNTSPIKSGNLIEITSSWMEPIDEKTGKTGRELAGIVDDLSMDVNDGILDRILNGINDTTEAYNNATKRAVTGIQNVSDFLLSPLTTSIDAINNTFMATQNALNATLLATVFQVEQVVGQIQDLIQIPVASNRDLKSRKASYNDFITSVSALTNTSANEYSKNENLMVELALASAIVAQSQVVISTPFKSVNDNDQNVLGILSRADVIDTIVDLQNAYDSIIETMDTTQEAFSALPIDRQYHSFSEVYSTLARLVSTTIAYLLTVIFDLSVERTLVLRKDRNPLDVTITEYGGLGENDFYLDLLIASNELTAEELLLIPAGTTLKIYEINA